VGKIAYDLRQLKRINNLKKINIIYQKTKKDFFRGRRLYTVDFLNIAKMYNLIYREDFFSFG